MAMTAVRDGFPAQVLAFRVTRQKRNRDLLAVVELDDFYVPRGAPTMFNATDLHSELSALEDPRLFVHRGALYLLAYGLWSAVAPDGRREWPLHGDGRQYLARLERLPAATDSTAMAGSAGGGPAGFRLTRLRQLLLPEAVPRGLTLPRDINIQKPHEEKNWVPFVHNDTIHFVYSLNPPVVLRVVEDKADAGDSGDIQTEFVSVGGSAVRWRYGTMRGGTPAVYDAALGGYIAAFHSHLFIGRTPSGDRRILYYFMGFYVLAAQPPFSIQLMSAVPVVGPRLYEQRNAENKHVVFPVGLTLLPESISVSYGRNDEDTRVVQFDRRELMQTLQPPLPERWDGPPC